MNNAYQIATKVPSQCSNEEISTFVHLVKQGAEVSAAGLRSRVMEAARLAFLMRANQARGVAALKRPKPSYRSGVSSACGVALPDSSFPFELGWIFINREDRGQHQSLRLSKSVLSEASLEGVFATARIDNVPMRKTLANLAFVAAGATYMSRRGGYELQLFIRAV